MALRLPLGFSQDLPTAGAFYNNIKYWHAAAQMCFIRVQRLTQTQAKRRGREWIRLKQRQGNSRIQDDIRTGSRKKDWTMNRLRA